MTAKKPGVMLYFRWKNALRLLDEQQLGRLFLAILEYGESGQEPRTEDRFLLFAWNAIRPDMDNDTLRYQRVVEKRRQAANKRWEQTDRPGAIPAGDSRPFPRTGKSGSSLPAYSDPEVMNRYL